MAHKPTDWLAPLIEHEIQAALTWYRKTIGYPKVKKDPESRFDDDGSNLRSEVEPSSLPGGTTAQIVKILSTDDPLLLITDGVTLIRTRFSSEALASLESEIGEQIDLDTKGDVFSIRKCTVVITPYGPSEGHVQLQVDEIEYHYHLRRVIGAATPAGQRPEIAHLIGEVMRARHPEPVTEPPAQGSQPRQNGVPQRSSHSDPFETQAMHPDPQSPASQASIVIASSPPVPTSQSIQTQAPVSTQIPAKRKRNAPTFMKDGVEMPMGVNLDRPTAANPSRPAPDRAAVSDSSAGLLRLLGKQNIKPEVQGDAPVAPVKSSHWSVRPASPEQRQSVGEGAAQQVPSSKGAQDAIAVPEVSQEASTVKKHSRPARRPYWQRAIPPAQQRLLDSPTSWLPALPGRQFPHPNIPMELLSKWNEQAETRPESVMLSQSAPSRSQEAPLAGGAEDSRPQETTTESSEEEESESDDEQLAWSSSPPRPAAAQVNAQSANQQSRPPGSNHSAMHSSPFGSHSSEQFLSSPAHALSRPSTAEKRPDLPPDSSFEKAVAPRPLHNRDSHRDYNSMPTRHARRPSPPPQSRRPRPSASSQPFPPGGDLYMPSSSVAKRSLSPPLSRRRPSASSQPFPRGGDSYRPSYPHPAGSDRSRSPPRHSLPTRTSPNQSLTRGNFRGSIQYRPLAPDSQAPETASPEQGMRSTQRTGNGASSAQPTRHISQSPAQPKPTPVAPPSTGTTVIKATQMSRLSQSDGAKDERPASHDPNLEHMQRRSEHFKGLQRRQWIRANYTPNTKKSFSMSALLSAYKKAHPRDQPRLSDLAEAYRDVFPDDGSGDGNGGQDKGSLGGQQADKNVPDTIPRARASLADEEGADATPSKILNKDRAPTRGADTSAGNLGDQVVVVETSTPVETATKGRKRSAEATDNSSRGMPNGMRTAREPLEGPSSRRGLAAPSRTGGKMAPPATLPTKAPAPPAPTAPSTGSTALKSAPDHRAWLMKQIEREQRRLRSEGLSRQAGGAETSIKAFADAWRGVQPGGAFARERREGEDGRKAGRLRVLGWEL